MGLLVDGQWQDRWYDTDKTGGRFERSASQLRNWVTPDGEPGPSGRGGFKAEPGRYHLYVSYACPWAHRTLIYRALKGQEDMISVSVVDWLMGENGWTFKDRGDGIVGDDLFGKDFLYQVYLESEPDYSGRVTVPVLWDKQTGRIVSNESAEIIRMFNSAFDGVGAAAGDWYPQDRRDEIDALNDRIYETVNNGVYKSGFATTQDAYEEAVRPLFDSLNWIEGILAETRFLTGDTPTEADWRLLPTLLRFDLVYHGHFKCNIRRIADYPNLSGYMRELYQWPGIAGTCNFDHAKKHYYASHENVNPTGIVPVGPALDLERPHGRG
ncbi:glutathione S-transferase family protein [Maricaulis sp.]|uniref:glutathione S-transferase family protein n=1 Tax=Maricaulis sp. TaxID=1486257 RepID=UPI001B1565D0|nr:glutathione S-transferase family protein [Maricaulis sp.]MBO6764539.1 glutathione S-transferase family protein [Maricaulis sp.]